MLDVFVLINKCKCILIEIAMEKNYGKITVDQALPCQLIMPQQIRSIAHYSLRRNFTLHIKRTWHNK